MSLWDNWAKMDSQNKYLRMETFLLEEMAKQNVVQGSPNLSVFLRQQEAAAWDISTHGVIGFLIFF